MISATPLSNLTLINFHTFRRFLPGLLCGLLCGLLVACATEEPTRISEEVSYEVVDMSGNWEKDYQLSDDFDTEFNLFIFDIQRRLNPQSDSLNRSPSLSVGQASGSRETIIGLARFTEEITRMPLLQIEQDRSRMRIDREDDFSLLCEFFNEQTAITQTPFGSEECGWNGEQLLFQLNLDDGLRIFYQITLAPNGQQLNITTTVSSASVSTPMTISNYYRRYDIPENEFDCILTLTRNNVCRRSSN
ncbi:MAG: hypothetical protein ACI934_001174 [Pseudohongiellaceae bacterium]|jgi:hypothetical protein